MNAEAILRVADAIEKGSVPDLGFNMNTFRSRAFPLDEDPVYDKSGRGCGTVACIGGWTCEVLLGERGSMKRAANLLGIRYDQEDELFYATNYPGGDGIVGPLRQITQAQAVAVLRRLAATGEVDWSAS